MVIGSTESDRVFCKVAWGRAVTYSLSIYPVKNVYTKAANHSFGIKHARFLQQAHSADIALPVQSVKTSASVHGKCRRALPLSDNDGKTIHTASCGCLDCVVSRVQVQQSSLVHESCMRRLSAAIAAAFELG
jgi:hypothetical protein